MERDRRQRRAEVRPQRKARVAKTKKTRFRKEAPPSPRGTRRVRAFARSRARPKKKLALAFRSREGDRSTYRELDRVQLAQGLHGLDHLCGEGVAGKSWSVARSTRGVSRPPGVGNAERVVRFLRRCGRKNNKIHAVSRRATRRCGRAFAPGRPAIRPGSAPITPRRAGIETLDLTGVARSRACPRGTRGPPGPIHDRALLAGANPVK